MASGTILSSPKCNSYFITGPYLNEALNSEDKGVFLIALRDVIDARGNIKGFAEKADIPRPSIYRMLSEDGNPTIEKLAAIFEAMGFKIQVTLA
jgi:probable addiction module antidote protein